MWTDGRTDGETDRQGDSYIPPQTMFAGGIINFLVNSGHYGSPTIMLESIW